MNLNIIVLSVLIGITNGQLLETGPCPNIPSITDFDQSRFSGTWQTVVQYPNLYETITRCPTITYGINPDGTYSITQSAIPLINNPTQGKASFTALGTLNNSTIGQWNYQVPNMNLDFINVPYQLLATDYETFATIYSCISAGPVNFSFLWVMTKRYPLFVPQGSLQAGINAAGNVGLNTAYLVPAIQLFCTLPTFDDLLKLVMG